MNGSGNGMISLLFFLALLGIWALVAYLQIWPKILVPSPEDVGLYFWHGILDGSLIDASYVTLKRLLVGYSIGVAIGLPLGVLNARFRIFEATLGVLALGLQTLPSICWAPLALLWFGQTETAMLFIVIMGSLWSILIATDAGVRQVPLLIIRAARTFGSHGFHTWVKVLIPAALPYIVTGMKQGWAFAWRSLMAAEIFITILTGFGLGALLHYNRELLAMDGVVAIMFLIVAIGFLIDKVLFSPLEKYIHRRWGVNTV
jgi:NitT/TauT family transport system permease protein